MIEKPRPEQVMSNYSILGRVVLPPSIFEILEHTPNGAGGELQLTDAMRTLARQEGVVAVDYNGTRYDMATNSAFCRPILRWVCSTRRPVPA